MTSLIDRPTVVCAGILVADLFVPPLARLPEAGELLATGDFLVDSGGCAANTATALSKLGVRAAVSGKVGGDVFGDFVAQDLARKGVDTTGISRSATHGTSKTVILPVTGQDRRYIHTFGANADFTADDIDATQIAAAAVFYVGGYLVLPGLQPERLRDMLERAQAGGARTVLDVVVPAGDDAQAMADLARVLPFVDVVMPNDDEARRLTGEREPRRQAERLLEHGCGSVVITQGERGALLLGRDVCIEARPFAVDVVDESGAGDAFAAGYIAGLLEGWPPERIVRFASALGASACTALGCNAGVFTRAQAEAFLAEG